jgi:hypothetical protein
MRVADTSVWITGARRRRDGQDVAQRAVELIRASQRASVERVDECHEDEAWRWLAFGGGFSAAGYVEVRP